MKKHIIKYILLVAGLILTFSCNKVLDLKPINEISDVSFWNTPDQFRLAANEFYTYERTFTDVIQDNPHSDVRSDFLTGSSKNNYSNGTNSLTTTDNSYNNDYAHLRSINYLLSKAATYSNPSDIAVYIGEAKFFRAYTYFDLVQQFGDVPLITEPIDVNSGELNMPRTSRDSVINFILQDLNDAIAVLPLESALGSANEGRVTQGAAQAFLSRVTLYEGTWQKFRNNINRANELLDIAIASSKAVMSSSEYYLFGTQGASAVLGDSAEKYMFILENQKSNPAGVVKTDNKEYILANRYDYNLRQIRFNITQTVLGNAGVNWPTRKFADQFLCSDGLPPEKSPLFQGHGTTRSEYINRDNRMRYDFMIDSNYYWDDKQPSYRVTWLSDSIDRAHSQGRRNVAYGTGYQNQKWATERQLNDQEEAYDFPVIRYAEVLLNYAEAVYERNDAISDQDLDISLNLVRNRVNKNMPKLSNELVSANGLDMREEIRRERNVELYYEGFRLNDLKRWKTAETEMPMDIKGVTWAGTPFEVRWNLNSATNPPPPYIPPYPLDANGILIIETGRTWADKNYLYPIPTSQIALNPNLAQNPGW